MPSATPNSRTWTLRFKHHRSTVLLHVDPLQSLTTVRAELLTALQQTHPDGKVNGHVIPRDESGIILARPADINDLSVGWELLEPDSTDLAAITDDEKAKGKGKASVTSGRSKQSKDKLTDCPQGVGLRDGGVVAFKFRSERELEKKAAQDDEGIEVDGEERMLNGETLVGAEVKESWDVVVPSMDETYAEGNADMEAAEAMRMDGGMK